jgi:hypothetical protein
MKAGFHAEEHLSQILERKLEEQRALGVLYWGYGGSLCHPLTQVQPHAQAAARMGSSVRVLFVETASKPSLNKTSASEWSSDSTEWWALPETVKVTSSKHALVLRHLRLEPQVIDLNAYQVAQGPSIGTLLSRYFRGRVDKACAVHAESPQLPSYAVQVVAQAELHEPYSVFLR